ncbi:MAG: ethylbenzene dehydrogenase-related protein [Candidatus Omnitrophica bacterium]|nr:ethylbenzene dehydrogenase-related protein [Candidatus Omnitrophota bacterium]
MARRIIWGLGLAAVFWVGLAGYAYAEQTIIAQKVGEVPVIDGSGNDPVWEKARAIVTQDGIADIPLTLKAVYTDKEIFFLVSFPDPDESRRHKDWVWNKASQMYKPGLMREDVFVLKWNMGPKHVDLSVYADEPYTTDIWFWKAGRTDPVGFADDKIDILNVSETPKSMKITSKSGKPMSLQRLGDAGEPAYVDTLPVEYEGETLPNFKNQTPTASRADIKAKGTWSSGQWTIEFARALHTGNGDDVQFTPGEKYQFGVSRYEIAGRSPEPEATQPLYGTGDTSEELYLSFSQ